MITKMNIKNRKAVLRDPLPLFVSARVMARMVMLLAIFVASNMAGCGGADSQSKARDEAEVQKVFTAFRSAVVAKNTGVAAALVSKASLDYASHIYDVALYAPRETLEAEPVSTEMYVLMLRMNYTAQQLKAMQPTDVLAFGIAKGFVGNLWQAEDQLQGFRFISADAGSGERVRHQRPIGAPVRLVRGGADTWRMDILPELEMLNENMRTLAKDRHLSERTVARAVVEFQSMKQLQPRYFEPLLTRNLVTPGRHDA